MKLKPIELPTSTERRTPYIAVMIDHEQGRLLQHRPAVRDDENYSEERDVHGKLAIRSYTQGVRFIEAGNIDAWLDSETIEYNMPEIERPLTRFHLPFCTASKTNEYPADVGELGFEAIRGRTAVRLTYMREAFASVDEAVTRGLDALQRMREAAMGAGMRFEVMSGYEHPSFQAPEVYVRATARFPENEFGQLPQAIRKMEDILAEYHTK